MGAVCKPVFNIFPFSRHVFTLINASESIPIIYRGQKAESYFCFLQKKSAILNPHVAKHYANIVKNSNKIR